jgi:hypothetical protein
VPANVPPGLYAVEVGWYDAKTQERLPVDGGTSQRIAVLPVSWTDLGSQPLEPVGTRNLGSAKEARFGKAIQLDGYRTEFDRDSVALSLRWFASAPLDVDYAVFVHLVEPGRPDRVLAQGDALPVGGRWPTSLWLPGVAVDDAHTVPLPPDLPPGTYALLVGLYDPATGKRLLLPDGRDALRLDELVLP